MIEFWHDLFLLNITKCPFLWKSHLELSKSLDSNRALFHSPFFHKAYAGAGIVKGSDPKEEHDEISHLENLDGCGVL